MAIWGVAALIGWYDVIQRRHSILRNYPVIGHARYLLESIRPEIQQYFIERNTDGRPFNRDARAMIYDRARAIDGEQAFGTELDVNAGGLRVRSCTPRRRVAPPDDSTGPHRRHRMHPALRHLAAERLRDELRIAVLECDPRPEHGRAAWAASPTTPAKAA